MQIEQMPIGELTPYAKNAKKHPKAQVEQIAESIRQFGMDDPIAVWGPDNLVVEGHGRLLACKKLGMDTVPVIRLDHLTDEQRRAYTLAHNKLTMNTDFNPDMLDEWRWMCMPTVAELSKVVNDLKPEIAQVAERVEAHSSLIAKLETEQKEQGRLVVAVEKLANGMDSMKEKIVELSGNVKRMDCRMTDIEQKPAKRWDGLVEKMLLTGAAGLVGYFLSKIGM